MMTIQQTIDIPADRRLRLDFDLPETVPTGAAEFVLIFKTVSPEKPAIRRFSMEQINAWSRAPEIQSLVGALKGTGLATDVSMKDIRTMRLTEKYGKSTSPLQVAGSVVSPEEVGLGFNTPLSSAASNGVSNPRPE
jgi:hypothetical protein